MDNRYTPPKVIQLHRKKEEENAEFLQKLADMAKAGELKGFIIAGYNAEGSIVTAALDVNAMDTQTLISYLQMKNVRNMIFGTDEDGGWN